MANNLGGNNAHTSNMIAGIFIATGQDVGQVGTSSMGIFDIEKIDSELIITMTLPCLEIGTIGGGTEIQKKNNCQSTTIKEKESIRR